MTNVIDRIPKEKFFQAYNKFKPNAWIRFGFKYFSTSTAKEDLKPRQTLTFILLGLFIYGFLGVALKWPEKFVIITTLIYTGILLVIGWIMWLTAIMNNARIRKICKELGISLWEYNILVNLYFKD